MLNKIKNLFSKKEKNVETKKNVKLNKEIGLTNVTVIELKEYAKQFGLKNYQNYKKTDLIEKIKELM